MVTVQEARYGCNLRIRKEITVMEDMIKILMRFSYNGFLNLVQMLMSTMAMNHDNNEH